MIRTKAFFHIVSEAEVEGFLEVVIDLIFSDSKIIIIFYTSQN